MVSMLPPRVGASGTPVSRKSYARLPQILDVPNLIAVQLDSFKWFQEQGLRELLEEVSPITDSTGNRLELSLVGYEFREPRASEQECRQRDLTYSAPLYVRTRLLAKGTGEIKEQDLFFGDIPQMTAKGTFITSGAERVVVRIGCVVTQMPFPDHSGLIFCDLECFCNGDFSPGESGRAPLRGDIQGAHPIWKAQRRRCAAAPATTSRNRSRTTNCSRRWSAHALGWG